ncbi:hypothetical protein AAY473_020149 [Plecturocebus cupreus]
MLARLASNSRPQVSRLPQPPKVLELQAKYPLGESESHPFLTVPVLQEAHSEVGSVELGILCPLAWAASPTPSSSEVHASPPPPGGGPDAHPASLAPLSRELQQPWGPHPSCLDLEKRWSLWLHRGSEETLYVDVELSFHSSDPIRPNSNTNAQRK